MDLNSSSAVSEKRSLKRNSGRRRSRNLTGYTFQGLCETIPRSLPPSERLLKLIEQWYRIAVSSKQNELMGKDDDPEAFQQKATECWEKIKASIQEKNLTDLAVAENMVDQDRSLHSIDKKLNKTIAALEAESDKWDEQISCHRESLQKKIDSPYTINESEWKNRDQLYDYSDVIKSASSVKESLSQNICLLKSVNSTLDVWTHYSKNLRQCTTKKAEKFLSASVAESSVTILRNMSINSKRNTNSSQSN